MTCTVIYYEITLKNAFVSVEVFYVQYHLVKKKLMLSRKHECLGEVTVVIDLFLLGCIGSDDFNVYH